VYLGKQLGQVRKANQAACVLTDLVKIWYRRRRKANAENSFHKTAMVDYDVLFKSNTNGGKLYIMNFYLITVSGCVFRLDESDITSRFDQSVLGQTSYTLECIKSRQNESRTRNAK